MKHVFRSMMLIVIASLAWGQAPPLLQFTPTADTIFIGSGCTPPMLTYSIYRDSSGADSILIRPGFNTGMSYHDSTGTTHSLDHSAFVVHDSTAQWTYEVWYHPIDTTWLYDSTFAVPPDSALEFYETFRWTVYVTSATQVVDSLSQVFFAQQFGLGIDSEPGRIVRFTLHPNYPNPFNAQTRISYTLHHSDAVTMTLYDITGRAVWSRSVQNQSPGRHQYQFTEPSIPSGFYYFRLATSSGSVTQKWCIIK